MASNIIDEVAKRINTEPLEKLDPNTQHLKNEETALSVEQVGLPVIMAAIYKGTRNEKDAAEVMKITSAKDMEKIIGAEHKENVINLVAQISGVSNEQATSGMEQILLESVAYIKEKVGTDGKKISALLTSQRSEILKRLHADMKLGEFLDDNGIDDRTNKMEGPASGLMHGIEKLFSTDN